MKRKNAFRIKKTWQGVVVGTVIGITVSIVCIFLLAAVLVKYDIPTASVKYLLFVPAVTGGLFSGGISGKFVRSRGFLWGLVSSSAVSLIFLTTLLTVNGFNIHFLTLLLLPVYAITGSIGGIIASNLK